MLYNMKAELPPSIPVAIFINQEEFKEHLLWKKTRM